MLRFILHSLLLLFSKLITFAYLPIKLYYKFQAPQKCCSVFEDLYFHSATVLSEKIRRKTILSSKVVAYYIKRVQSINPILNAVVEDRFKIALREARQVDAFLASTTLSVQQIRRAHPLLGVPLTVKEAISVAGMCNDAGRKHNGKFKARTDAEVVKQLKVAGAIIILVSNTPEMCLNWETFNYVTGRTLNPYDTRRTSGGSSGGEAVLLATCGSVIGVGSDLVGSLRLPPAFCGVYGHKPSPGLVSDEGHYPAYYDEGERDKWKSLFTLGPMTRYAVDLPLLLHVMVKPEKRDVAGVMEEINPINLKIYYMEDIGSPLTNSVDRQITNAIHEVISQLKSEGFTTKKAEIKSMSDAFDLSAIAFLNLKSLLNVFYYKERSIWREIANVVLLQPSVTPTAVLYVWLKFLFSLFSGRNRVENNRNLLEDLKMEVLDVLGDDGVLIVPAFTGVAHFHGEIYSKVLDTCYLGIFNALGLPVTVCPAGLNDEGIPIGIQVVSKPNNDRLCLALARELEIKFGGWIPPSYEGKQI